MAGQVRSCLSYKKLLFRILCIFVWLLIILYLESPYCINAKILVACFLSPAGLGCFTLVGRANCDGQGYHSLILWYVATVNTALCMISTLTLLFHRTLRYTWNTKIIWGFEYNSKFLCPWFKQLQLFDLFLLSLLKIIYKNQQLIERDIAITIVYLFSPLLPIMSLVTYFW
jgi:hypothetical protein